MAKHRKQSQVGRTVTKAAVATTALAATGTIPMILSASTADAATGSVLNGIAFCESGDNPTAQNPHSTASGLFQFLDSTWAGYGGYSRAKNAPASVQIAKAEATPLSAWAASESCWGSGRHNGSGLPGNSAPSVHAALTGNHYVASHPVVKPSPVPRVAKHASNAPAPGVHDVADTTPAHAPGNGNYYVVKSGDSLWRIAAAHEGGGQNWHSLYEKNLHSVGSNPNLIQVGETISL